MLKKLIKCAALACALFTVFSTAGCADTSWAVKVNNAKIPSGVYIAFLYVNRESVMSKAQEASTSGSSSSALLGGALSSSSSASSAASDPWSQTIENVNASTWAINNAVKSTKELAIAEQLAAQRNITLTSDENSSLSSYTSQIMSYYTGFKSNGVAQSSLQRMLKFNSFLLPKLVDSYYGKGGEKEVSESDLENYYTGNYADIKQIFLNTNNDEGNALPADTQTKLKTEANDIYTQLAADKSKFDALLKQYNQDTGMESNPGGYIFTKDDTQYLPIFTQTAFSMKVGDVKLIQSTEGWHIMYRVPTDPKASSFDTSMKEQVLQAMKTDDMKKLLDSKLSSAKVVTNSSTINHYSPKKLKDS